MIKLIYKTLIVSSLMVATTLPVLAQQLMVSEGYVRATIPGTNVSSAYMTLKNNSNSAVTLIGATSDVSKRIEIHEHVMTDSMMSMRQRQQLVIDGGSQVQLQPYGYHLMIFNLDQPLVASENVTITLQFLQGEPQKVVLPIHSIKKLSKDSHKHH
ncbi:copper chaperone PCu(A)C [Thalassotalea piscium]|uniref:Copper chaperone PCu(A)C n=1 Tax=Thalassotalea piscium TaxID=1230533 RepID=A0A7X0NHA7_9GAMM|nr:copper chaperone PCu(A)C [Thalassotalea piscium]MBB6543461.1 hypothetical protein [Thalassotalea piscium]